MDRSVDQRVDDLVSLMTLTEKAQILDNDAQGVSRLGIKGARYWNECLHGVEHVPLSTVFPQSIGLSCTWNRELIWAMTTAISDEARAYTNIEGKNLSYFSPMINVARDPRWGRTEETYGEDPYLVGELAVAYVKGLQGDDPKYLKAIATPKHFVANNEESRRLYASSMVDERSLREYYFPAFRKAIQEGGAYSIMSAYNGLNGIPASLNRFLLTNVLRDEWGFDGYVITDCGAINFAYTMHKYVTTAVLAASLGGKAGNDANCGYGTYGDYLPRAVKDGYISENELDTIVKRVLKSRFLLGEFDDSSAVPYSTIPQSVVDCQEHRDLALRAAKESIVLLKNHNNILPLNKDLIKSIAVLGPFAATCQTGAYSGNPSYKVSPLDGIKKKVNNGTKVSYIEGTTITGKDNFIPISKDFLVPADGLQGRGLKAVYFANKSMEGDPVVERVDEFIQFNWGASSPASGIPADNFSVCWTGKLVPDKTGLYSLALRSNQGVQLYVNGKLGIDFWNMNAWAKRNPEADAYKIEMKAGQEYDVKIEYYALEGDASLEFAWSLPSSSRFAEAQKMASDADVAVLFVGIDKTVATENSDRKNLLLSGEQAELVKAVYSVNPNTVVVLVNSAPLAINWTQENVPGILCTWFAGQEQGNAIADVLFGDYNPGGKLTTTWYKSVADLPSMEDYNVRNNRTYMYFKGKPLYPFGYGLSYTDFTYSNLKVSDDSLAPDKALNVTVDITNTGSVAGDEVVQMYVQYNSTDIIRPIKELRGFERVSLKPGETRTINMPLEHKSLFYYDEKLRANVVDSGKLGILVGSSSQDIRLEADISVVGCKLEDTYRQDPFTEIQSVYFSEKSSAVKFGLCAGGGMCMEALTNGSYLAYGNMNFDDAGKSFKATLNATHGGGQIDIVLDSTIGLKVGTLKISATGDVYQEQTCQIEDIKGVHDIYLVFSGDATSICKLKSIAFKK